MSRTSNANTVVFCSHLFPERSSECETMSEAEGGRFPWKLQRIRQNGPVADNGGIRNPLPDPPQGMVWRQNQETKEWRNVPEGGLFLDEDAPRMLVDGGPLLVQENDEESKYGEDWEVLSDRISQGSFGGAAIMVPRGTGGSTTISITSLDNSSAFSPAYRVHRTHSSSTIDSTEGTLSSLVTGILGVDYVEHVVLPSDTFQGLCLAYKISGTRLRQVNHFSGTSLTYAPKKLIIPLTKKALRSGFIRVQDKESREYKLHAVMVEVPTLKEAEAKAYLEDADWIVEDAIQSAIEDGEWEQEVEDGRRSHKGGEIRIKVHLEKGVPVGFRAQGAGDQEAYGKMAGKMESVATGVVDMTIYEELPAIATKDVSHQDVYEAAPQHNAFGVEMQPLVRKSNPSH